MRWRFFAVLLLAISLFCQNIQAGSIFEKLKELSKSDSYEYDCFNNWQLNISGGTQEYFGDDDLKSGLFVQRITPAFSASLKKHLGNFLGYQFKFNVGSFCGADEYKNLQRFSSEDLTTDLMVNVNRIIWPKRNIVPVVFWPYIGLGVANVNKSKGVTDGGIYPLFNLGGCVITPVNEKLDFTLELKGVIVPDAFDGKVSRRPYDGYTTLLFGVNYHF